MKKIITVLLLAILTTFVLGSCAAAENDSGKLKVMATIFPQYDFARQISGETADVEMLIMPGSDIHNYELPPRDMIRIRNCDLFIYNGGESDNWIFKTLESMGSDAPPSLSLNEIIIPVLEKVTPGMTTDHDDHDDHDDEEYDEHVWTSPKNVIIITKVIADKMCELDPSNAAAYTKNAEDYIALLDKLDADFRLLSESAARHTIMFADRFPFRYFADEYGFDYFAAFPGCSHETEPSAAGVAFLIDKIKADKIPYVFTIEFSNKRIAQTLAEETGAGILEMHSAHNLSKADFNSGLTYEALMRNNLENLKIALN